MDPLEIAVDKATLVEELKAVILDAVDDILSGGTFSGATLSGPKNVANAGAQFDTLLGHLADFFQTGLATGDAAWPPAAW